MRAPCSWPRPRRRGLCRPRDRRRRRSAARESAACPVLRSPRRTRPCQCERRCAWIVHPLYGGACPRANLEGGGGTPAPLTGAPPPQPIPPRGVVLAAPPAPPFAPPPLLVAPP